MEICICIELLFVHDIYMNFSQVFCYFLNLFLKKKIFKMVIVNLTIILICLSLIMVHANMHNIYYELLYISLFHLSIPGGRGMLHFL